MAYKGVASSRITAKATAHKSLKYDSCPACRSTKYVNYIKQVQRGMRLFTCAKCTLMFFTWGPIIKKPRPLRGSNGQNLRFVNEMGEDND